MKKNKRVLITSYYFEPEITPRAFRTTELVNEFIKRGYVVDVYIPEIGEENKKISENCVVHYINSRKVISTQRNFNSKPNHKQKKGSIFKLFKKSLDRLTGGVNYLLYGYNLYKELLKNRGREYELVISIGLPVHVHFATALFLAKDKQKCVKVSDYGDPFFYNPAQRPISYLKHVEKWATKQFDYITIPTPKSIEYYTEFKREEHIKIIPQGFDFSSVEINDYEPNSVPTFCYAGYFYENIRNPKFFLDFLSTLTIDYKFVIYTDLKEGFSRDICLYYKEKLGSKLIIKDFIPREELIKEASKMDFLINFDNFNSNQVPSKIIDYSLTRRPILNINQGNFKEITFFEFIREDYSNSLNVDIREYDIKNVVDKFEKLSKIKSS